MEPQKPDEEVVKPVVKVYTEDPFSYNYVALNKSKVDELQVPTMDVIKTDDTYYRVGKALGIEDPHDWPKYYDKVFIISEWAKERTGSNDPEVILKWIEHASKYLPDMGSRKISDLYNHMRISLVKGKNE
jgi:hypothetical protein